MMKIIAFCRLETLHLNKITTILIIYFYKLTAIISTINYKFVYRSKEKNIMTLVSLKQNKSKEFLGV